MAGGGEAGNLGVCRRGSVCADLITALSTAEHCPLEPAATDHDCPGTRRIHSNNTALTHQLAPPPPPTPAPPHFLPFPPPLASTDNSRSPKDMALGISVLHGAQLAVMELPFQKKKGLVLALNLPICVPCVFL